MTSLNSYLLIPFNGLIKISTSIMEQVSFNEWYGFFFNLESLIKTRGYKYKNGEKMAKMTKQELLTLEKKYEKANEII